MFKQTCSKLVSVTSFNQHAIPLIVDLECTRLDPYIESSVQRYDPDPAAKAAAASVLASKLGADSGLKVYMGEENMMDAPTGKSNDVEVARTTGLRNRKASTSKFEGPETASGYHPEEGMLNQVEFEGGVDDFSQQHQLVVEHHPQTGGISQDGGWFARIAALLVGEDPTQSYALICGNCHIHNGKNNATCM